MNKKIKNIASVVQTKSAAVLCTLCAVLFLASCAEDEMADGTHSQKQDLRTVSVNFDMPADKPSFGDGTASRAALDVQPAEILLGDSTLAVSRAEGSTANYSTSSWANGDQLLVRIEAGSTEARLTLKFITLNAPISDGEPQAAIAGTWYLMKSKSYVKYTGNAFSAYNAQDVTPLFAEVNGEDSEKLPINGTLTMHIDYSSVATQPTVSIIYAPDMKWSLVQDKTVSMEQKNPATTATTAPELWTVGANGWVTNQARLRVNTGTRNAGDVVTLTSSAFDSAWEVEPTVGEGENKKTVFTAVTDDQGDAYFYGATVDAQGNPSALTDGFLVQLTQMRVAVQPPSDSQGGEASPTSEGRSVSLENENTLLITLDTPITLLEASDVVPVTLAADNAYKLMANVKRTASAQANLSVIDGSVGGKTKGTVDDVATVKAQIETAMAMDINDFTVINQLARDYDPHEAETVVGQAIHDLASDESSPNYGTISITIADATELSNGAFIECYALQSVTFNQPVAIRGWVFRNCTALTGMDWANVASIGAAAFGGCTFTGPITINQGTELLSEAFEDCTITGTLTIGEGVTVNAAAFQDAIVSNCDLVLPANQVTNITVSNGKLMWAGAEWASIKVGETEYTAVGDVLCSTNNGVPTTVIDGVTYAVLDGQATLDVIVGILEKALATETNITNFYLINQLTSYSNQGSAGSVVGEAIRQLLSPAVQSSARAVNGNCKINLVLADATSVPDNAFNGCTALASVSFEKSVTIGDNAFSGCTALTDIPWDKVTSIGQKAFKGCTITGTLTIGEGVTVDAAAFHDAIVSDCDLVLPADQVTNITASNSKLMWAGAVWKSITVGDKQYTAVGNTLCELRNGVPVKVIDDVTYAVLDCMYGNYTGTDGTEEQFNTYRDNLMAQITTAYTVGITHFYVINELGTYKYEKVVVEEFYGESYSRTITLTLCVVGEAFTAFAKENAGARVSITLADATSVPEGAFSGCTALENIELDMVESIGHSAFEGCTALKSITTAATTIEGSAFYGCTSLESATLSAVTEINGWVFCNCTSLKNLTFGAVITTLWNNMFDKFDNVTNCDLTLASGQQHMNNDGPSTPNGTLVTSAESTWGGYTWKSITIQ